MITVWTFCLANLSVVRLQLLQYLASPMQGRGSSNHCVCVCVCVFVCVSATALASTTNALKAKVRYQQKALVAGNEIFGYDSY